MPEEPTHDAHTGHRVGLADRASGLLGVLTVLWTRVGNVLHRLASPVVLGLVFFLLLTPIGLVMRALGKDPLRLKPEPAAKTYWIAREPPGPAPDSLRHLF